MRILLTGMAGFIGFHTAKALCNEHNIVGIDNLNDYYSVNLKRNRLKVLGFNSVLEKGKNLSEKNSMVFYKMDLNDDTVFSLFEEYQFDCVIHLAAQAGVRYSLENPDAYIESNIKGFLNILEACRKFSVKHLIYASSSSVYGMNSKVPYSESDSVDHPVSLYAATKKSNELMAHTYSHLFGIPTTGLRFFTVYGPWGRPDMAYFSFTEKILKGETLNIFNHGKMMRDFTFVDDIVEPIKRLISLPPEASDDIQMLESPHTSNAPFRVCNIGNNEPIELRSFIETIESIIGKEAKKEYLDMQLGDVVKTWADVKFLNEITGYKPTTSFHEGFSKFYEWYKNY